MPKDVLQAKGHENWYSNSCLGFLLKTKYPSFHGQSHSWKWQLGRYKLSSKVCQTSGIHEKDKSQPIPWTCPHQCSGQKLAHKVKIHVKLCSSSQLQKVQHLPWMMSLLSAPFLSQKWTTDVNSLPKLPKQIPEVEVVTAKSDLSRTSYPKVAPKFP